MLNNAGRLLIGCVTPNHKKYNSQALRLVQSLRLFGGKIAEADFLVCFVEKASPQYVSELKKWGAKTRIVKRFSKLYPTCNKLRFFEISDIYSYDTVMLLDCDTVIAQDPYPYIDGRHLQAKIADKPTFPNYREVLGYYGLPVPNCKYRTTDNDKPMIWYCNTGVLIMPKQIIKKLFPAWKKYTIDLIEKNLLHGRFSYFCEQASLSIAFIKEPVPFKELPIEMNYKLSRYFNKDCDPVIIHYHNMVHDTGLLKGLPKNPTAFKRIRLFNRRIKKLI